jgi:hypothetical protein
MTDPASALHAGGRGCPSCGTRMQRGAFGDHAGGAIEIEACLDCRGIWFDALESVRLSPRGTIDLLRVINDARARPERPLEPRLHCPACRGALDLTHDIQHTTRFTYFRCDAGHGRFTPFVQFLREKEFVRELSGAEVARLRATVQQVRCTGCGGAIDLARDGKCPYCGMPIAILDADAVQRALERLDEGARGSRPAPAPVPDAAAILAALAAPERSRPAAPGYFGRAASPTPARDLVGEVLDLILPGGFP